MFEVRTIHPVRTLSSLMGLYGKAAFRAAEFEIPFWNIEFHRFRHFAERKSEININKSFSELGHLVSLLWRKSHFTAFLSACTW